MVDFKLTAGQQAAARLRARPATVPQTRLPPAISNEEDWYKLLAWHPWNVESGVTFNVGLDWGTTTSSCCLDIPEKSGKSAAGNVNAARIVVRQGNKTFRVPSKAAIIPGPPAALGEHRTCKMVFGTDVEQGVVEGVIEPEDVFDLLKYAMHPDYSTDKEDPAYANLDPLLKEAKEKHTALCTRIKEEFGGKVVVWDDVTASDLKWDIKNIEDVIVAFLNFMLRSARVQVAFKLKLQIYGATKNTQQIKDLMHIFAKELQVAVSVPAAWPRVVQDRFMVLLSRAGFPASTGIVPEATAAVIYHFNRRSPLDDPKSGPEDLIVTDIGGSTLEGAGVRRFLKAREEQFVQTVPPVSSYDGSLKLNLILEQRIRKMAGGEDGIEIIKREFDNKCEKWRIEVPLPPGTDISMIDVPWRLRSHLTFKIVGDRIFLYLSRELVKIVFDMWLDDVVKFILGLLYGFRKICQSGDPRVVLNGWGSFPPYVLQGCRDRLAAAKANVNVECIEDCRSPSIAQGNFFNLMRKDLFCDVVARTSYGIQHQISRTSMPTNADYRETEQLRSNDGKFLLDRALWVVRKGTNLSEPETPLIVQGTKRVKVVSRGEKSRFPITWDIEIIVSADENVIGIDEYRPVQNALSEGQISKVPGLSVQMYGRDCNFRIESWTQDDGQKVSIVEFDFRLRVHLDDLLPTLVVSIPKKGKFSLPISHDWTEESEECHTHKIHLAHLCTHATMRGIKEAQQDAGWPVHKDDVPEVDFDEDMDLDEL